MKTRNGILTAAFLLLVGTADGAQILTGTVIGTVRDESSAVLPGVTVTLSAPTLVGGSTTVTTNERGEYRFTQLDPGVFTLTATLSGFSTYKEEGLQVGLGATIERNVPLKVGAMSETVTVSGETPMVDARMAGMSSSLKEESLEALPTHRYYLTEYGKWTAGVTATDPSGRGSDVSVMGAGTGENTVLYDGIVANNPNGGGLWASSDLDAVEEVQVTTIGGSAEYQMAQGGVFNVAYKSGTNNFHGDGSAFWYPDALISKPLTLPCNCPLGQTGYTNVMWRNVSGHLGGPIKKDKLFFYGGGNYDGRRQGNPGVDPELLKQSPLWYSHSTFTKVTWQVNDKINFRQTWEMDPYGGQSVATVTNPIVTLAPNFGLVPVYASQLTYTITSNLLLTVRATGFYDPDYEQRALSGDHVTPRRVDATTGIACCGVAQIGRSNLSRHGQAVKVNRYIQGDRAEHDLRFGLQLDRGYSDSTQAFPSGVQYSDLSGRPDQATFRAPFVNGALYNAQGVWAEDQVTLARRLTLSLGARYDHMKANSPDEEAVDNLLNPTGTTIKGLGDMFTWNVLAPRVGFNLRLREAGGTVLRGSYGRAYRQIFTNEFNNVHPGLSPITLARFNAATNSYSTIISVTDPIANIRIDPDIEAPFTDSYSVGFDHQLAKNVGVNITYGHKDGKRQVGWRDIGGVYAPVASVLPNGRTVTVLSLVNAASARIFLRTNGPDFYTKYNGIVFGVNKRMSNRWSANVGYTFSKAEGLTTTGNNGQDPNDYVNRDGLQDTDRPHVFTVAANYDVPFVGVMVSGNYMAVSGTSYAPQAQIQLPQGRRSVNIAPSDGTYRVPFQNSLNFRLNKPVIKSGFRRVEVGAEILNVLQDKGFNAVATQNFFASNFGASSGSWVEPRRMNFVVRVQF